MALSNDAPTVQSYIDSDGSVYLYTQPRWGAIRMQESLPRPLFTLKGSRYNTDGAWWEVQQPLSNDSIDALTQSVNTGNDTNEYYLVDTRGPGVVMNNSFIPSQYRVVTPIPSHLIAKMRVTSLGLKRFIGDKIADFEERWWTPPRMNTAWKYAQAFLPADIPLWEVSEAKEVFMRNKRGVYIAAVSLAASRRHYFDNRRSYNAYVLGREETEEERQQRLDYSRDARVMASFYRAFSGPDGRAVLLRKTKNQGAKRLANAHDREYKELYERLEKQYELMIEEINVWMNEAYGRSN